MRKEIIGAATLTTAIYALVEWGSEMPRYVGKTVQYLHERHKAHIRDAYEMTAQQADLLEGLK